MFRRNGGPTSGWIVVVALVACLGITEILAWQAVYAARGHKESAEKMVRSYASTAAAEFLGRSRTQIDYYGLVPALRAILDWEEAHRGGALPPVSDVMNVANDRQKQGLQLATGFFRIRSGEIEIGEGVTHDGSHGVQSDLIKRLNDKPLDVRQIRVLTMDDGVRLAVTQDGEGGVIGMEVSNQVAADYFRRSHDGTPLVPSLSSGGLENEEVFIRVTDTTGEKLFESSGHWNAETGVEYEVTDEFGEFLSGMLLQASIDTDAARRIVAGGIPTTRLPMLLVMLAVNALLLIMAIFQIRRERQLAALRSDFVSGVSHELRTPLTQIRMFSETLMLGRTRSEEEQRKAIAIIDQEARRLTHLVENILQFSRSERGAITIAPSQVDVTALVEETLESFRPVASSRETSITFVADGHPMAEVDGDALRQVVLNLLDNALKYGPAGQTISVCLTTTADAVRISVDDEGPGVPQDRRDRIWDRFFRLETNQNTAVGGSGIGLSVVRDLVRLHGGSTAVEDGPGGTGARFVITLPIAHHGTMDPAARPEPAEAS